MNCWVKTSIQLGVDFYPKKKMHFPRVTVSTKYELRKKKSNGTPRNIISLLGITHTVNVFACGFHTRHVYAVYYCARIVVSPYRRIQFVFQVKKNNIHIKKPYRFMSAFQ